MAYIEDFFHFYETVESYQAHSKLNLINPDSICFIKESGQIITQGTIFGICKSRFETLEQLALEIHTKLNNILGIEGPSTSTKSIDNLPEIIEFLSGYNTEENLSDILSAMNNAIYKSIEAVSNELKKELEVLATDIDGINALLNAYGSRLDSHDTTLDSINRVLNSHIRDYEKLKNSFDNFKSYTEGTISSITSSINSINNSVENINERVYGIREDLDDMQDLVIEAKSYLDNAKYLIQEVNDRIDNILNTKGEPNGIASLDENGKVPSTQLPSYVDDVIEYPSLGSLPSVGESGKIYVTIDNNKQYRWSGTQYTEVSKSLALGETSSTAYAGDKGKAVADNLDTHKVDYENPHRVTKAQVGLENVDNTRDIDKPISTAVQEALNSKVSIEPGKGLVSLEEAKKIAATNAAVDQLTEKINSEINRATTAEGTINNALSIHKVDNTNPHGVTKEQVGLENVDNTSDLDKPISTAVQEALNNIQDDIKEAVSNSSKTFFVTFDIDNNTSSDNTELIDYINNNAVDESGPKDVLIYIEALATIDDGEKTTRCVLYGTADIIDFVSTGGKLLPICVSKGICAEGYEEIACLFSLRIKEDSIELIDVIINKPMTTTTINNLCLKLNS